MSAVDFSSTTKRPVATSGSWMWTLLAVLIAVPIALPLGVVVGALLFPTSEVWSHLAATVLPTYALNTVSLMLMVGLLATAMGVGAAWLTAHYRFIGSDW
ncbi:MAG: hypothetical protein VX140_11915, partial [Pseudomonadota bacterium]|nr:hypothetical protein [Pseudomonadota bacterium]